MPKSNVSHDRYQKPQKEEVRHSILFFRCADQKWSAHFSASSCQKQNGTKRNGNLTVITRCRLRKTHHSADRREAKKSSVFLPSSADSHYLLQKIVVEFFYSVFYEVRHLGMDVFSFGNDVGRQFDISQFCLCNEGAFEVIESGFDDKEP